MCKNVVLHDLKLFKISNLFVLLIFFTSLATSNCAHSQIYFGWASSNNANKIYLTQLLLISLINQIFTVHDRSYNTSLSMQLLAFLIHKWNSNRLFATKYSLITKHYLSSMYFLTVADHTVGIPSSMLLVQTVDFSSTRTIFEFCCCSWGHKTGLYWIPSSML